MVVAAILQATLLPYLSIEGVKPHLVLVLVCIWGLLSGSKEASLWALMGGFVLDLFSSAPFGVATLSLVAVGLLSGWEQVRGIHSTVLLPILVAVTSVGHDLVFWVQLQLLGWHIPLAEEMLQTVLVGMLLNVGLAFVLYPLVRWLSQMAEAEEGPGRYDG